RQKILVEDDPEKLEHLKIIYDMIPNAQFIVSHSIVSANTRQHPKIEEQQMSSGAGKYDDICVDVLEKTNATCACVIVIDGKKGNGFSVNSVSRDIIN